MLEFTGTAFLVSASGALLTNRHLALPWEEDSSVEFMLEQGLEPEFRHHVGSGLNARLGKVPEIKLIEDEVILIHEGNKNTSLHDLDVLFANNELQLD